MRRCHTVQMMKSTFYLIALVNFKVKIENFYVTAQQCVVMSDEVKLYVIIEQLTGKPAVLR